MRKILMNKPNEFQYKMDGNESRSVAVKMLAKVFFRKEKDDDKQSCVTVILDKPIKD